MVAVPSRNKHSLVPAQTLEGCPNRCDRTGLWGRTGEGKCLLFSVLASALLELVRALPKNSTQLNQNSPEACAPALGLQAAPGGLGEADEPAAVVGPQGASLRASRGAWVTGHIASLVRPLVIWCLPSVVTF